MRVLSKIEKGEKAVVVALKKHLKQGPSLEIFGVHRGKSIFTKGYSASAFKRKLYLSMRKIKIK